MCNDKNGIQHAQKFQARPLKRQLQLQKTFFLFLLLLVRENDALFSRTIL